MSTDSSTNSNNAPRGFRLQKHLDAMDASHYCFKDKSEFASLPTGVTLHYTLHEYKAQDSTDNHHPIQEEEVENVVLIMGLVSVQELWGYILELLVDKWAQKNYTRKLNVLTFDNKGIGKSDVPVGKYTTSGMAADARALMDHLGWTKAHIVGTSMGGMISLEFANNFPEYVQSLSLIVTTRGRFVLGIEHIGPIAKLFLSSDPETAVSNLLTGLYPSSFLSRDMEDRKEKLRDILYNIHMKARNHRVDSTMTGLIGQTCAVITHYVSDARLKEIRDQGFPILIIGAKYDIMVPFCETEKLSKLLAGDHVKTVIYKDAGHGILTQYGEEVLDELLENFKAASSTAQAASNNDYSI